MYKITLIPFESLKSFECKKVEYHHSITFQWPFFWKKKDLINGFFVNIIILPMLNYF
jgi:hypothetical protein